MQLKRFLRNGLVHILILSFCLISVPKPAHAANLDTLIDILRTIEQVAPPGTLPFTVNEVESAKGLLECMINAGGDIYASALCADEFLESAVQIPAWVPFCLDLFIMLASHDYYGLAKKLATDPEVVCAILSILIPGPPICDLLAELVAVAEGLYDVGNVVYEFFGEVLGAAYGAAKDAYCATAGHLLGGCGDDDGPDIPPEVFVYERFFHPRLAEGLAARKSTNAGAFDGLVGQLKNTAAAFAQNHQPVPFELIDTILAIYCSNSGVVKQAADMFTSTVNSLWTADLANNVLPLRSEKFNQYNNPANVQAITLQALQTFHSNTWYPQTAVVNSCVQTFDNVYGFAHIDRWLEMVGTLGGEAQQLKSVVHSNQDVCDTFWDLNKIKIGQVVYSYTQQNHCSQLGSKLQCNTIPNYRSCMGLLSPFGAKDSCRANTITTGKEAKDKVMQKITARGTALPWQSEPPHQTGLQALSGHSEIPYKLIGTRPTHTYYCEQFYSEEYGDLPQRLLQCSHKSPQNYLDLVAAVNHAVEQIYVDFEVELLAGQYHDPLIVAAGLAGHVNDLKRENPVFGFKSPSAKPGFDYSLQTLPTSIDGINTPLIYFNFQGAVTNHIHEILTPAGQNIQDMGGDPRDEISGLDQLASMDSNVQLQVESGLQRSGMVSGENKILGQQASMDANVQLQATPGLQQSGMVSGGNKIPGQQAVGTQQQPMSGTLPAGQFPSNSPTQLSVAKGAKTAPALKGRPDLQAAATLDINGNRARWNGLLTLDAAKLKSVGGGRCQVPTRLVIKNTGTEASSPCRMGWPGMSDLRELPALAPGKTHTIETIIELAPGIHRLQLQLDKLQQVEESNEQNNAAAMTLKLTGTCNGSLRNTPPSKPAMSTNRPNGALPVKPLPLKPANSQLEPKGAIQAR
jgi:hypothetical protein